MLFSFSAGNDGVYGANSITPPATAKNIITVGATGNDKWGLPHTTVAGFSSQGPTADGRIKPDVVIPGHILASARSIDPNACRGWSKPSDGQTSYIYASGTSMAAPGVAGVAAVVTQYLVEEKDMDPSPAILKASLINGAQPLPGYQYPGFKQGWGTIDVSKTIFENGTYRIFRDDQRVGLEASGGKDVETYHFMVKSDQHLKVTLVWTDPGGTSASGKHMINDLDLELFDSQGNRYAGNDFENGESLSSSTTYQDRINNVEGFLIKTPKSGIWTIRVKAFNVPQGPQDFALVVSGNVEEGHVDLVPASIDATPQGLEEFNTATLSSTFKNTGNRIAALFDYKVEQVHPDGSVTVLTQANVTDLGGGLQTSRGWNFVGERGQHTLRVTLDPQDLVIESNETNNVLELQYFYKGFDAGVGAREPVVSADPAILVEFNLTVTNRGNVADEFRVGISTAPPGWTAQLVADTFNLEASETSSVRLSVITPANATAGELADIVFTATSQGNTTKTDTVALRVQVNQVFGLELVASVEHLKLYPGDSGEFTLLVSNPGNGRDTYEMVTPTGLDPGWWPAIPEPTLTVGFRSQVSASLQLTAPDPSPAGSSIRFTITVRSTRSGMEETVSLTAVVLQFFDNVYEVTYRDDRAEVGTTIQVGLTVENLGNGPVHYTFDVLAPSSTWQANFDRPFLDIPGYGWASTNLTFTVPDDAISQTYNFSIAALPNDGDDLQHGFSFSVLQYHQLEVSVVSETPTVTQGMATDVKVRLRNLGNGVENVKVLLPDLPGLWSLDQDTNQYQVQPFSELELTLTIQTNRESPGGQYEITILTRYGPSPQLTATAKAYIVIRTRPDLVVRQGVLNVSEVEPLVGSLVQLSIKVENTGQTAGRNVYIQFYVNNRPLGQPLYSTSIDPGEIQTYSMNWIANVSGLHQISVVVDSTMDVDETREDNNRAQTQVSVQALDLQTSPGFGAVALVIAISVAVLLGSVRRKR